MRVPRGSIGMVSIVPGMPGRRALRFVINRFFLRISQSGAGVRLLPAGGRAGIFVRRAMRMVPPSCCIATGAPSGRFPATVGSIHPSEACFGADALNVWLPSSQAELHSPCVVPSRRQPSCCATRFAGVRQSAAHRDAGAARPRPGVGCRRQSNQDLPRYCPQPPCRMHASRSGPATQPHGPADRAGGLR